jgi:hypothetical protein
MATINLQLQPFPVPTHVTISMPAGRKQDGIKPLPTLALTDLSDEVLSALIEEFATNVMKAARPE